MKIKEIRERQTEALKHELADCQKRLFELRTQAVTEKLEDPSRIRKTRRDIARIKTVLRQREMQQQKQPAATAPAGAENQKA